MRLTASARNASAMIGKAWSDQKEIREVMVFLQGHGVSAGYATKIFKQYRNQSIEVVKENPYRLATDIFGIGFITADKIAENLGFAKDSPMRAQAGILYVLNQLSDEGHVYYPQEQLLEKSSEILGVDRNIISEALSQLATQKRIVIEGLFAETDEDNRIGGCRLPLLVPRVRSWNRLPVEETPECSSLQAQDRRGKGN